MSLKENIDMVKDELNQEEKLFESAVKTERFVKKYKTPLISTFVAVVLVLVGKSAYDMNVQNSITASNEAYLTLIESAEDISAAKILKENNRALYDGWKLQVALKAKDETVLASLTSSSSSVVSDLARYELATLKKDKTALNTYALSQDAVLKDLAILNEAVLLIQEGKVQEAQIRLKLINEKSNLHKMVVMLQHYGVQ